MLLGLVMGMLVVAPVFAEKNDRENKDSRFFSYKEKGDFLASSLMDKPLYVTENERVPESAAALPDGWESIGDISDCVLTREGQVSAVIVDVGGFLGIATRAVAVSMQAVEFVEMEDSHDFFVVVPGVTREDIEAAPEFELQPTPAPIRRF